jgi:colanic acid/amylovoran biosynthesis glycosyltransferase
MQYPLAVLAPVIGQASETFIRRHMSDLLPGRTAVVAATSNHAGEDYWTPDEPCLILDRRLPQITSARVWSQSRQAALTATRRFLKQQGVRAILCEYLHFSTEFLEISHELKIPLIAHAHGFDVSRLMRIPEWRSRYGCLNSARAIVVVSRRQESLLRELPIDSTEIKLIPCGVDVPRKPRRRPQKTLVQCLAVGRMVAKKAPILLLDAFRRAVAVEPQLRLDYVGGGELLAAAIQFVRAFELQDHVRLHGPQTHEKVLRLMRRADIFVQHSMTDELTGDEEGLPVSILESMAAALPVVATRHAGIPDAVEDEQNGYLVDEGDSKSMAKRLIHLTRNSGLRQQMGGAGWARCRDSFSWERERSALLAMLGFENWGVSYDERTPHATPD